MSLKSPIDGLMVLIIRKIQNLSSVTSLSPVTLLLGGDIIKLYFILSILCDTALTSIKRGSYPVLIYILSINI